MRTPAMYTIGLTGGIGSGKSSVADLLSQWGAAVIDTDDISRTLTTANGAAIAAIEHAFGPQALMSNGALNRTWMRERVFADCLARARLEALLHPLIHKQAELLARQARGCYLVYVVPLLVESAGWRERVDRICVVDCDPQTQLARVQSRSGLTSSIIKRIMAAQTARATRLHAADDVILNDGDTSTAALCTQTKVLHDRWCGLASSRGRCTMDNSGISE
jgi:dephospho-CoA kinase